MPLLRERRRAGLDNYSLLVDGLTRYHSRVKRGPITCLAVAKTETTMTEPDTVAFLESWADELTARSDRVRNLIGDAHWLSDGHHKEALLRDFIRHHCSPQFIVSSGFIRTISGGGLCSPEVDIMIADASAHASFFSESNLYITAPTSVVAHMQVKTSFRKPEVVSALDNVFQCQQIVATNGRPEKVWRAIFFYDVPESRTSESILETLENSISELWQSKRLTDPQSIDQSLPVCVAALSNWVIFLSPIVSDVVSLRLFDLRRLSAAFAMIDLFSALRRWCGGEIQSDLDRIVESLSLSTPVIRKIHLR